MIPKVKLLDAFKARLEPDPMGGLVLRAWGRSIHGVRVLLCRPLTAPMELAVMVDEEGKEIGLLTNLAGLDKASRSALDLAVKQRDLTARITAVRSLFHQFGGMHWRVETDRGPREFVLTGPTEHVRWITDRRLLITDVDGNRFEILDLEGLDKKSKDLVEEVL